MLSSGGKPGAKAEEGTALGPGAAWSLGEIVELTEESALRGATPAQAGRLAAAARALIALGREPESRSVAFTVPGRIEILGKHTDYAGGRSLVAATEQGFCMVGAARGDRRIRMTDLALSGGEPDTGEFEVGDGSPSPDRRWLTYPMTVARRLDHDFPGALGGADVAFSSDLPQAAGISSSSALVTGVFLVLAALGRVAEHPRFLGEVRGREGLAGYLGAVENGLAFGGLGETGGVGTLGGSEDHAAILCSEAGRLGEFDYLPVRHGRSFSPPVGHLFAIGFSGVAAEKSGAAREAYNRVSRLAADAAAAWRRATGGDEPHLAAALAAAGGAESLVAQIGRVAEGEELTLLERRARHFALETELVTSAGDALEAVDVAAFGDIARRSHELGLELLENQTVGTAFLAETAWSHGAVAASAFGAGFGGSVWALVPAGTAGDFLARWSTDYEHAFPQEAGGARFFLTRAGRGARPVARRTG